MNIYNTRDCCGQPERDRIYCCPASTPVMLPGPTGTLLTIAPLLVLYTVLQRKFIEGIERTGLTGE